ncbi:hypothetical protein ACFV29_31790 [Streptomyces sp. NPDC059690]|uniref:hypothetical protein n=1 Tax=Streptomyces sp. NPDC059690 TaxID=3346907 RepID=UPI003685B912
MRLHKRAVAAVFVAAIALAAPAAQAVAAPMPWETSRLPTARDHHVSSTAAGGSGTVTVLCTGGCYQ